MYRFAVSMQTRVPRFESLVSVRRALDGPSYVLITGTNTKGDMTQVCSG